MDEHNLREATEFANLRQRERNELLTNRPAEHGRLMDLVREGNQEFQWELSERGFRLNPKTGQAEKVYGYLPHPFLKNKNGDPLPVMFHRDPWAKLKRMEHKAPRGYLKHLRRMLGEDDGPAPVGTVLRADPDIPERLSGQEAEDFEEKRRRLQTEIEFGIGEK